MRHLNISKEPLDFYKIIRNKLYTKYSSENNYNLYITNIILSNNKSLIVAKFKDFLLFEDLSEFLKRFYRLEEIGSRLKKLFNYFHKFFLIQPNYCLLNEYKYMITNLFIKQMILNKEMKKKHKLLKTTKKEDKLISSSNKIFFNNTIYNEILNQSESFMNALFGIDKRNKINENDVKFDEQKEIDDVIKLINLIERYEVKKNNKINDNKEKCKKNNINKLNNYNSQYFINKKNVRKIWNDVNSMNFNTISNTNSLINNINPNIQKILNRYNTNHKIKEFKKDITINNKIHIESSKNDEINKEISKKTINNFYINKKNEKILYHRKMKTSLLGGYLNQLDLPSNSNVINYLKKANEEYANNFKSNKYKIGLYKKVNFGKRIKDNSNEIIKFKNFYSNNLTRENTNISNNFGTPMKNDIMTSKYLKRNMTKINIKKKYIITYKKENSSIYKRNHINSGLPSNTSKKYLFTNNKNETNKNILLTSLQNSETKINKYNNSNTKEVYSKPKALYKYKANGISVKKLLNS